MINNGGAGRDRTDDLLRAKQPLYQLSYGPGDSHLALRQCIESGRAFWLLIFPGRESGKERKTLSKNYFVR